MYQKIIKPILFRFNPEKVHDFFIWFGEFAGSFWILRKFFGLIYGYRGKEIGKTIDGLYYKTPIVLSAGFDYNARLTRILPYLGFGGVEVGSVTVRPCEGNPKPRLKRLVKSKSILVNKGLRNQGADAIIQRLKNTPREKDFVIGVSIARTNDELSASTEEGVEDFFYSFRRLNEENVGDYYTINISCPNVFGGETFATPDLLFRLLSKIKSIPCDKPIYVKLPINLSLGETDALLEIIDKLGFNGVVVGNLNKKYADLDFREEAPQKYSGGISGKPCFTLSNQLIKHIREKYKNRFTIFGCGGVLSPEDALVKLQSGSDLLQMITGIIFMGPGLIRQICKSLSA
jgi:dihydroorotate dehydrogenase